MRNLHPLASETLMTELATMCRTVAQAMDTATRAVTHGDIAAADSVIEADWRIAEVAAVVEAESSLIVAGERPSSERLWLAIGALRIASSLERMGDLAEHVAKLAMLRHPSRVIPSDLVPMFWDLGRLDVAIARKVADVIDLRDLSCIAEIEVFEAQVDARYRDVLEILQSDDWAQGATTAVDLALLSKYYERYADHAVLVTERVAAIVDELG